VTKSPVSANAPRVLPTLDEHTRGFWTSGADGVLRVQHCASCARFVLPPRGGCPDCAAACDYVAVSGDATLFTYTVAHQQFHPSVPTPFIIAVVELTEQPELRMVTNIVDCDPADLVTGMGLSVRFERHDELYFPVFAPAALT